VLSYGENGRGMVRVCVDRRETILSSWETGCNICAEDAIYCCSVDTLEECKGGGVEDAWVSEIVHLLDYETGMLVSKAINVE